MPNPSPPRVQFVISGKFVAFLLVAASLLGGGYYWYTQQQIARKAALQRQQRFNSPPYFINHGPSVVRSCLRCLLEGGQLRPQAEWKVGLPKEIQPPEQQWLLAVENPPLPVTVSGVLMLPVHPAWRDNPAFGFDLGRVELVLYQNLQRMNYIEQPPAAAPASPPAMETTAPPVSTDPPPAVPPSQPEAPAQPDPPPPNTEPPKPTLPPVPPAVPKVVVTGQHTWTVTLGDTAEWFDTGIPLIAEQHLTINLEGGASATGVRLWSTKIGSAVISPEPPNMSLQKDILETDQSITGPSWLDSLRLRSDHPGSAAVRLVVHTEYLDRPRQMHVYQNDRPGAWDSHSGQHLAMRVRAELAIGRMKTTQ